MTKDNVMLVGTLACLSALLIMGLAVWIPCWTLGVWCE